MRLYASSLYWCLATMTSTGYGDIHAYNSSEMWVASLVMMVGKLLFGIILANIASTLAHAQVQRVHYERKMFSIKVGTCFTRFRNTCKTVIVHSHSYMGVMGVEPDMQTRVSELHG